MKPPACDPGDFCMAQRAESTLFIAEITKSAGTPKRFQHVSPFPFFEVGFIGWIVRVGFAFDLDVPFDGSALGVVQPDFICLSFVIAGFTEECIWHFLTSTYIARSACPPYPTTTLRFLS